MKKVKLISLLAACSAIALINPMDEKPDAKKQNRVEKPVDQSLIIPHAELEVINRAHQGFVDLSQKSKKAKELLAFYDKHAVLAMQHPQGVRVVTVPKLNKYFFVYTDPVRQFIVPGSKPGAIFDCRDGNCTMFLRNFDFSTAIFGVLLSHETVHAHDALIKNLGVPAPMTYQWLFEELHAHETVRVILDQYTDYNYSAVVETSRKKRISIAKEQGKGQDSWIYGQFPEDIENLRVLIPNLKEQDLIILVPQLEIDANLSNIEKQGTLHKDSDAEVLQRKINYLEFFFKTANVHSK